MGGNGSSQIRRKDHEQTFVETGSKYAMMGGPKWPQKLIALSLDLPKELAWQSGRELTGLSCSKRSEGWLLVLRAVKKGRKEVAFVGGRDYAECWENAIWGVENGGLRWRDDRYER